MKRTILFLAPLLCALVAHADLTIEQKLESPILSGTTITKIKGSLMRVDTPLPNGGGNVSTIIDLQNNKMTTLMAAQKMAMPMDLTSIKKQAQAMLNQNAAAGGAKPAAPLKPVGSEKVGEWNTDIYEMNLGGSTVRAWVAKDFPDAAELKKQMAKIAEAQGGNPSIADTTAFNNLPGFPVKTETNSPAGKITTTVVSVKQTPLPDSDFKVPADYQVVTMPALPGGAGAEPGAPAPPATK